MMKKVTLAERLKTHSRMITSGALLFIAMLALSYKLMKQREGGIERDYHFAYLLLDEWKGGEDENFAKLTAILKKRPALNSQIGPHIAQHLLSEKKIKDAKELIDHLSTQQMTESSTHQEYADTTLAISSGDFVMALNQAKTLDETKELSKSTPILYGFNLLRIALLEKEVGTKKGEEAAWKRVEKLDVAVLASLQEVFRLSEVTLTDYIKHRKAALKS